MTVLVSGFGPWGGFDENPTLLVLDRLAGLPGLVTLALPVDTARLAGLVTDALERHRPSLRLGLGLAYGSAAVAVERVATNRRDFGEPDAAGAVEHGTLVPDGPDTLEASVPAEAICDRLRAAGIPARVSESAGGFLCNQLFYTLLHTSRGGGMRAGFLHVPAHPGLVARQSGQRAEAPSMAVDLVAAAAHLAIEVATAPDPRPLAST